MRAIHRRKLLLLGKTFDFSLELLSVDFGEKLIELCPGYDVFPPSMGVLEMCPPQGFEIHFLFNYYFLSCFLLFPLPRQ